MFSKNAKYQARNAADIGNIDKFLNEAVSLILSAVKLMGAGHDLYQRFLNYSVCSGNATGMLHILEAAAI